MGMVCACSTDPSPKTLQDLLNHAGLLFQNADRFKVIEQYSRRRQSTFVLSATTRSRDTVIKIELIRNIAPDAARAFINERKYAVLSLYQSIGAAYPGAITHRTSSPDAFIPEQVLLSIETVETVIYLLLSNARFNYGVTSDDLAHYRGALLFFYHPGRRLLIRMDLFIPKARFDRQSVLKWIGTLSFKKTDKAVEDNPFASEPVPFEKQKKKLSSQPSLINKKGYSGYNLILIAFEPLGATHVGAYGYPKNTTPNLDRFAQKAVLFKQAISPSSWTLPVFMSWFTGMYPSQHGLVNKYKINASGGQTLSNLNDKAPTALTLAQVLKQHGYQSVGFTGGAALSHTFGYAVGFDVYDDTVTFGGFDRTFPLALKWLKEKRKDKFFLFVQGFDVHGRYPLPTGKDNPFLMENHTAGFDGSAQAYWQLRNLSIECGSLELSKEQRRNWINTYDAKIFEADKRFGHFMAALGRMGLVKNTIVIISSGSGNEYGEHQRFDHGFSLYDELIRVPFIIKIPGIKNRVIDAQVRTLDIMPTIMDLLVLPADKTLSKQMQGKSLWPLINGRSMQLDAFSETDYLLQAFKRSLRTADGWKLIYSLDSEQRELFNLSNDPEELINLIDKKQRMAYTLEQRLFKHLDALKSKSFK
jgi:arylsulfatase A-like enzyme